jgi:hypothetical protein
MFCRLNCHAESHQNCSAFFGYQVVDVVLMNALIRDFASVVVEAGFAIPTRQVVKDSLLLVSSSILVIRHVRSAPLGK